MNFKSHTLSLTILAVALSLASGSAQASAVQAELERLEKAWNEAHVAGDAAALDALWADELVVTVPKMPLFNKAQTLAIWRSGTVKMKRYETSDLAFHIMGDTAVVTGAL